VGYGSNTTTDNEDPRIDDSFEPIQPQLSDDYFPPLRVHIPGGGPAYWAEGTVGIGNWDVPVQTACDGVFDTNGDDMNVNGVGGGLGWLTDGVTQVRIEFLRQRGDHKKRNSPLNVNRNIRCNQVNGGTQLQNPGAVPLSETRLDYNFEQTKFGVSADTVVGQSGPVKVIFGVGAGMVFRDTDTVFEIKVDQFNFMSKTTNEIDTDRLFAELSGGLQFPVFGQVIGHAGATLIVDYDSVNGTSTYNETVVPTTQVRELSDSEVNPSVQIVGGISFPVLPGVQVAGEGRARIGNTVYVIEAIPGSGAALRTREVDSYGVHLRVVVIPRVWRPKK